MTSEPFYPRIDNDYLTPLRALRGLTLATPDLLTRPECPYPADVVAFLSSILGVAGGDDNVRLLHTSEDLERELSKVYKDLQNTEKSIANIDAKDKIAWAKASVGLLERLVDLRERVFNLKNLSDFQKAVVQVLDEVLEPAQRTMFVERLGRFVSSDTPKS